jgi:hypothetical protein
MTLSRSRTVDSGGKLRMIFNAIILVFSILATLIIIIAWRIFDFSVIMSYILSTIVSLFIFHQLKVGLLQSSSYNAEQPVQMRFPLGFGKKHSLLLFTFIALILATPLIILFIIPHLWLVVLNGMVSGATISELVLYLQKNRIYNMS